MTTGPVRDFDFHPDEQDVRVFTAQPDAVLELSDDAFVSAARYGDVVLWHYAFARHWFKVNLTTDLDGRIVETGGDGPAGRFAVNCDIATPMRRQGNDVFAVDLVADVLVRADATTYRVCDLDEFAQARRGGLILPAEARGATHGLTELTALINGGDLLRFLSSTRPIGPVDPPPALPVAHVPRAQVPLLRPEPRATLARGAVALEPRARPGRPSGAGNGRGLSVPPSARGSDA